MKTIDYMMMDGVCYRLEMNDNISKLYINDTNEFVSEMTIQGEEYYESL